MATALVTGSSRGIGRAIALALASDGHDVAVAFAKRQADAAAVVLEIEALGSRAVAVAADLADSSAPARLIAETEERLGPVGVLVANAGITTPPTGVRDISLADWERLLAVNLTATFLLAQGVFGGMCEQRYGRIVLISSVAAVTGGLVGAHYAASKAGLHGLAHSLAREGGGHGVTVNVIAPGLIDTDMLPADDAIRQQLAASRVVGRLGTAGEVADLVAAVVRNGYLSNQSILLDGGTHPL
jgi:3-oxoacyl-[acyl-carrier protein] reductase